MVSYDTLINESQGIVYNVLSANSNLTALAKVVDGFPEAITKGIGSFVIVPSPIVPETRRTFTKRASNITVPIECYSRREASVRQIADLVRKSINDAIHTPTTGFHANGLMRPFIQTAGENRIELSDGQYYYVYNLTISFDFVADVD